MDFTSSMILINYKPINGFSFKTPFAISSGLIHRMARTLLVLGVFRAFCFQRIIIVSK